ncbi:S9 family peptidase [candidate division KSB1 bacterium]|nr:S9 family peptidase [candidate division KSB1 bacterium]
MVKNFLTPLLILLIFVILCTLSCEKQAKIQYPKTAKVDVVDDYFGTKVADPYRWLEDDTTKAVETWVTEQNKVTFSYLEKIPFRSALRQRLDEIYNYPKYSMPFKKGPYYYFRKNDGLQNQSVLYIQEGPQGDAEVLLDPNTFSADGTTRLSMATPSKDARYFAYGISKGGSDWQEFFVLDLKTGAKLADHLKWIKFSDVAWQGDGFYYSRYEAPADTSKALSATNENHKIYYHKLGDPQSQDRLIYADPKHPTRLFFSGITEDERFLIIMIYDTGKKGNALYVMDLQQKDKKLKPLIETFDNDNYAVENIGSQLLVFTNKNAPKGQVVLIDPDKSAEANWKVILPEKEETLIGATMAGGKLFATYSKDVTHRVYVHDTNGTLENEVELPTLGAVYGFSGEKNDTTTFYTFTSFTYPTTIYEYHITSHQSTLFRKSEAKFEPADYETKQVFFASKDGTKVPMFIVHRKGLVLNGQNPTLVYGYGGFNVNMEPYFSSLRIAWLEQGGVYVSVNLRGGGEYGEKWHEAGMKLNKQNVFDDFIAAAECLIANKYTSSEKLAMEGGSNGGLLVGAIMTQRPDLFKVALAEVGVMDMLRYHKFTIGHHWSGEYGSSDDSTDFKNLLGYSPLHNLKEGVSYPATLTTTADHDDRVVPAHSFKFAATLQEKHSGTNPVLIRIDTKSGHGSSSTTKALDETADIYAFTFHNLGVKPKF